MECFAYDLPLFQPVNRRFEVSGEAGEAGHVGAVQDLPGAA